MAGFQLEFIKDDNQNNEVMSAMACQSAVQLLTELNHDIHVYQAIEDIVPDLSEEYRRMYQKAQGLDYIMRIKAPEDPQAKEEAAMMEEARMEAIQEDIETAQAQAGHNLLAPSLPKTQNQTRNSKRPRLSPGPFHINNPTANIPSQKEVTRWLERTPSVTQPNPK